MNDFLRRLMDMMDQLGQPSPPIQPQQQQMPLTDPRTGQLAMGPPAPNSTLMRPNQPGANVQNLREVPLEQPQQRDIQIVQAQHMPPPIHVGVHDPTWAQGMMQGTHPMLPPQSVGSQFGGPGLGQQNAAPQQQQPMARGGSAGKVAHPVSVDVGEPTGGGGAVGHVTIEHPDGTKIHIPGLVFKHIMKNKPKKEE